MLQDLRLGEEGLSPGTVLGAPSQVLAHLPSLASPTRGWVMGLGMICHPWPWVCLQQQNRILDDVRERDIKGKR